MLAASLLVLQDEEPLVSAEWGGEVRTLYRVPSEQHLQTTIVTRFRISILMLKTINKWKIKRMMIKIES